MLRFNNNCALVHYTYKRKSEVGMSFSSRKQTDQIMRHLMDQGGRHESYATAPETVLTFLLE